MHSAWPRDKGLTSSSYAIVLPIIPGIGGSSIGRSFRICRGVMYDGGTGLEVHSTIGAHCRERNSSVGDASETIELDPPRPGLGQRHGAALLSPGPSAAEAGLRVV